MPCTALHKCFPDGRPEVQVSCGYQELEKQACLGQGTCKAELSDASVFLVTGFDHCQADHAQGNHVYEDLLVKPHWGAAMSSKGSRLSKGTTDIDVLEAGWNDLDSGKIVIYGNIGPKPNILDKLSTMASVIEAADAKAFKVLEFKVALILKIKAVRLLIANSQYKSGLLALQGDILSKIKNCSRTGKRAGGGWISGCDLRQSLLWSIEEIIYQIPMTGQPFPARQGGLISFNTLTSKVKSL